jgi:hypothetical protein
MTNGERFLFEAIRARAIPRHSGFQLLADDNLTPEEWRKFRAIANERLPQIADAALAITPNGTVRLVDEALDWSRHKLREAASTASRNALGKPRFRSLQRCISVNIMDIVSIFCGAGIGCFWAGSTIHSVGRQRR